jgi:hypothetical protein
MQHRMPWTTGSAWSIGMALFCVCCAHHRKVMVPAPEGKTSVRVLNAPESPPPAAGDGAPAPPAERITPAYASADNGLPEYPAYALKAGCGQGTVAVRVHVSSEGNVSAQRDVPDRPLPADECHMAFRAAIQTAVNSWRFAPAFRQTPIVDPAADRRAPVLRWKQEAIAVYLDFEFSFEVVAGKGVVRSR